MHDFTSSALFITTLITFLALFFISSLLHVARKERKMFFETIIKPHDIWQWYKAVHRCIFRDMSLESILFSLTCAQQTLRVLSVVFASAVYAGSLSLSHYLESYAWINFFEIIKCFVFFFILIAVFILISDLLPRMWAQNSPQSLVRISKLPGALFLLILSPLIGMLYHLVKLAFSPESTFKPFEEQKKQIVELIEDLEDEKAINEHDKRLITSVFNFRHRIAREIMKPRVELFCVPETMTIEEASYKMLQEGYSRVPVYQENIDNITGILFYKDLLSFYMQQVSPKDRSEKADKSLKAPVKTLVKKVFYCPETKKISSLLQEFRKRQVHLAVVVDEYGGTSGVVTIEDILEEIVGEIADEYDDQETLFKRGPKGSWIVDAQLNLHDVSEELGIEIPQGDDYDTIAGYIFFRLGTIPKSGVVLHHDRFELKILKSNDRMVEEVLITPLSSTNMQKPDLALFDDSNDEPSSRQNS